MLDYTDIDQQHRSNSCLESYNNQIQKVIPANPTWYDLVEGLREEEYNCFTDSLTRERKGHIFQSSSNTTGNKKFLPEWAKKKLQKATNKPADEKPLFADDIKNTKAKGNPDPKTEKRKIDNSNHVPNSKDNVNAKVIKRKVDTSKQDQTKLSIKKPKQNDKNHPKIISVRQGFKNIHNSCRYDAFLTFISIRCITL
jgi:hypothetical protein